MLIGIVADDLTGAADSVAPFASRGLHADVAFTHRQKLRSEMPESEARAWTTETRDLSPDRSIVIRRLKRAATRRLKAYSPRLYYNKIDSTLRGHLRLELDAMRLELPGRLAIVCSASPANGRTVQDGVLSVHGEPKQRIRDVFRMQDEPMAAEINLETVREQAKNLPGLWGNLGRKGIQTIFCDAETPEDLEILAGVIVQHPERYLPVGSAGLSAALAGQMLADSPAQPLPAAIQERFSTGRVLVVVGSLNPVSRRQAQFIAAKANLIPIIVGHADGYVDYSELIQQRLDLGERLVLLQTSEELMPRRAGLIEAGMCYVGTMRLTNPELCLIITGGDTASSILSNLAGCPGMKIVGEHSPGVIAGELYGIESFKQYLHGMPLIVKAGGFGTEETLAHCVGLCV